MNPVNLNLPSDVMRYDDFKAQQAKTQDQLGRKEFLMLLTTQLKNQNPLDPMQNEAFVAQLAQFSTLEAVTTMSDSMGTMADTMKADRVLTGASLIGKKVAVPSGAATLTAGEPVAASVSLASGADSVQIDIIGRNGERVRTLTLGSQGPGVMPFIWDGLSDDGREMPDGLYRMEATVGLGGQLFKLPVSASAVVRGVAIDPRLGDLMLEIDGGWKVKLADVQRIGG